MNQEHQSNSHQGAGKKDVSLSLEMQTPKSLLNKTKDLVGHSSLGGRLIGLEQKEGVGSPPKVSPTGNKYLNLLEKVNTTQSNTNMLCTSIIRSNANFSPEAFREELSPKNKACEGKENYFTGNSLKNGLEGSLSGELGSLHKVSSKGVGALGGGFGAGNNIAARLLAEEMKNKYGNKGEIKNYENFFHFIENKVNDESKSGVSTSYQKTLFCSPHFKDQQEEIEC